MKRSPLHFALYWVAFFEERFFFFSLFFFSNKMPFVLPIEVVEKIIINLSNNDKIQCLLTCKTWYTHLYRVILHKVTIYSRRELILFLSVLQKHSAEDIGNYVKELYLKPGVGMTCEEFSLVGKYCWLLEVFKFSHWRYYKQNSFSQFQHLQQIPKLQDFRKGNFAMAETGNSLTHLELETSFVQELLNENRLCTFLHMGCNLTHLTLEGIFRVNYTRARFNTKLLEFNGSTWHAIHIACPHLVSMVMDNAILTATKKEAEIMASNEIEQIPQITDFKLTSLRMEHPVWLSYFARKYPNMKILKLDFMLGVFVSINQFTQNLDAQTCQEEFGRMANHLENVCYLAFRGVRESHFPGTAFFTALKSPKLEYVSVRYESGIVHLPGFNLPMLEALVHHREYTLTTLDVGMWIGAHENFRQFLEPLSLCKNLKELSISSEDYASFLYNPIPIDLILDQCTQLVDLSLFRTAIAIEEKHSVKRQHQLERLSLAVSKVSAEIFEYISARCRNLNDMTVDNCCWIPREVEMKINMPFTQFDTLHISGLNLFYVSRLEGNLAGGRSINLFSVTQLDKIEKQKARYDNRRNKSRRRESKNDIVKIPNPEEDLSSWYHSYLPNSRRSPSNRLTLIRRLYKPEVRVLKRLAQFFKENHHLVRMTSIEEVYDDEVLSKKYWRHDVKHGYVNIVCKSVHKLEYGLNSITWPHQ